MSKVWWSGLVVALLLSVLGSRVEAQLQITSPANGGSVNVGDSLLVTVAADATVQGVGVITERPLPAVQPTSSPNQFLLSIPAGFTPGVYHLTAVGVASGNPIQTPPLALFIERADNPSLIRVEPLIIRFRKVGEQIPLRVMGSFSDGSQTDVTNSIKTQYMSHDASVATVSATGIVTAVAPGSTSIEVNNASATFSIQVRVPAPPPTSLLLNNARFKINVQWSIPNSSGQGVPVQLTSDSGYFWFFSDSNVEMVIKVLNACGFNSRYWVYAGGLTNVHTVITITDTKTNTVKTYTTPAGPAFTPIQDTNAFATCP